MTTETNSRSEEGRPFRGEVPVLRTQDNDSTERTVEGYAAIYNEWITVSDYNGYVVREMDVGGLFDESLATDPQVTLKFNHQGAYATTQSGTLSLRSDDKGLFFSATIDIDNPRSRELAVEMGRGVLREASVAYRKKQEEATYRGGDGEDYKITRGDLEKGDVSVCLFGQNPLAWSSIKRELDTEFGHRVLRSLGYDRIVEESPVETSAVTAELVSEVVDFTEGADVGQAWDLHAKMRMLQVESGTGKDSLLR